MGGTIYNSSDIIIGTGNTDVASIGTAGSTAPTSVDLIGGQDNASKLQALLVDASGNLKTTATQNGTWSITSNIGTTGGLALDATLSSMSAKLPTALGQTTMAGSVSVAIASNQSAIPVSITGDTITVSNNIAQWGGTNTTLGQKVMASSVPVTLSSDQSALAVSQSGSWSVGQSGSWTVIADQGGSWSVNQAGSWTVAATQSGTWNINNISGTISLPTGAATSANQTTGNTSLSSIDGKLTTTVNGLKVDGSAVTQPVSGTITANAGTGNFTVVQATAANLNATVTGTVTANIGTTNGLALDTTLSKLNVAQGASLGANTGPMMQGSVTTASPAYTTGQISPLSLTTAGALRTDSSATTQPVSGTVTANIGTSGSLALDSTVSTMSGKLPATLGQKTMANSLAVAIASDQSAVPVTITGDTAILSNNIAQWGGTNTTVGQKTMASSVPVTLASDQSTINTSASQSGNWSVRIDDGSGNVITSQANGGQRALDVGVNVAGVQIDPRSIRALTSSDTVTVVQTVAANLNANVSGTVTVQQPTAANLNATVVQSGNWTTRVVGNAGGVMDAAGQNASSPANELLVAGQFNTSPTAITSGNVSPLQLDSSGNLKVNLNANSFGTLSQNIVQIGGSSVVTGGASGLLAVGGPVASGAANADNPIKMGGVFNTTQPTVTNGQIVDFQATARGAQIVATGTDTFNVTVNTSLPTGSNTIGAVTQASGPWTQNITQFGGTNLSTGTGASGAGIPRVTVANDSNILATQSGTWTVQQGATPTSIANAWPTKLTDGTNTASISSSGSVLVSGVAAVGSPPATNPITVAGVDTGGNKQYIKTSTSGHPLTDLNDGSGTALTSTAVEGKQALDTACHSGNIASYMASTNGEITTATTLNTVTSIAYLFHPSSVTKRYEIVRITCSINSLSANVGYVSIRGARITAENGTPGGTSQTINALDQADASSGGTFRTGATGAPTRAAGDYSTSNFGCAAANNNGQGAVDAVLFDENIAGKPIVLRASTNEGYEIRTVIGTALTSGVPVSVTFYWREV